MTRALGMAQQIAPNGHPFHRRRAKILLDPHVTGGLIPSCEVEMAFTVSQVARMAGVSVRTLHHYDEIGLLRPSGRSEAGYRLYQPAEVARLQQVLFFRALELPLEEIARIMTDPAFDVGAALRMQRQMLSEKAVQVRGLIAAVDAAILRLEKGETMASEDMFEVFRGFDPAEHEAEAERRWGGTEEYRQSKQRTSRYTKQDWLRIQAEGAEIYRQLAALMAAGTAPTSREAMDAAELHRQYISRWFYDCSRAVHRGLGELYVTDPRFTASIDQYGAGLSQYLCAAFAASADRS
jgi:DNA-binding transcriptional MerR regulator